MLENVHVTTSHVSFGCLRTGSTSRGRRSYRSSRRWPTSHWRRSTCFRRYQARAHPPVTVGGIGEVHCRRSPGNSLRRRATAGHGGTYHRGLGWRSSSCSRRRRRRGGFGFFSASLDQQKMRCQEKRKEIESNLLVYPAFQFFVIVEAIFFAQLRLDWATGTITATFPPPAQPAPRGRRLLFCYVKCESIFSPLFRKKVYYLVVWQGAQLWERLLAPSVSLAPL